MTGRIAEIVAIAVLACNAATARPQARGLTFGPPPSWVEAVPIPAKAETSKDDGNGIDELLVDRQIHAAEEALYTREARRFVSASGVERGSQLSFQWDPTYQTLTIHDVALIRGGERIDALRSKALNVLQREPGMEIGLFDGTLTAVLVIDDVRPGDTLEYSFTRTGRNPIFAGKYLDDFGMRAAVPIERLHFRLLWPRARRLFRKTHGDVPTPRMKSNDEITELVWDVKPAAALLVESDLPSWYDPFPWLQLSEFETWGDVARWAVPLYERGKPAKEIQALAKRFEAAGTTERERAGAALKFVQEEVRYLGLEMGTGSHRPNPPGLVLSRRFGDCKDKSLLLVALLEALGIEAWPALVHTGQRVEEWHPSPLAFNHVIVFARLDGSGFWLDPTQSRQGGDLAASSPPFHRALVLKPTTTSLTEMTAPKRSETLVREEWKVPALTEPATLTVTTQYRGPRANAMRAAFADQRRDAIEKNVLEFYTKRYPQIAAAKPIEIADDTVDNVVTLTESYTVANLFKTEERRGLIASIFPQEIRDAIPDPESRQRTMPLRLAYPVTVTHEAVIRLPEDWPITPMSRNVETPYFRFRESAAAEGGVVTFKHSWETLSDSIPAEKVPEALAKITTITEKLGWQLTHNGIVQAEAKVSGLANLNFPLAAVSVLFLGLCAGAAVMTARWQPARSTVEAALDPALAGLRGWLVLVGIGVVLSPLTLLGGIVKTFGDTFQADTWASLTSPGGDAFHPAWAPVLTVELLLNLFYLAFSVLQVVLFFGRKRSFPKLAIGLLVLILAGAIADAVVTGMLPIEDAAVLRSSRLLVVRSALQATIWIPYFLVSRRVRATFVH